MSSQKPLSHVIMPAADLPRLPLLIPALELLFKDSEGLSAEEPVPEMLS